WSTAMLRLSNIRIPVRIAIACLIPLLAFVGFAGKALLEQRSHLSRTDQIAALGEAVPTLTRLLHELQVERGASVGFINSKGKSFADQLRGRRPAVEKALAEWQQRIAPFVELHAGTAFARDIQGAGQKLAGLATTRSGVDAMTLKAAEAADF